MRFARRMSLKNVYKFAKGLIGDVDIPNQAVCMILLTNLCKFAKGLGEGIDIPNQAFARRMLMAKMCVKIVLFFVFVFMSVTLAFLKCTRIGLP